MMLSRVWTHVEMMKPRSLNFINEAFKELHVQIKLTGFSFIHWLLDANQNIPKLSWQKRHWNFLGRDKPPWPFFPMWQKTVNHLYKWGCTMEPFTPEAYLYTFLSSDKIADYNDMFFEPQILFSGVARIF